MFKKITVSIGMIFAITAINAQTLINQGGYDSKTLVDTNSTSNALEAKQLGEAQYGVGNVLNYTQIDE